MSNKNKVVSLPDIDALEEQAAEWLIRLDEGDVSIEEVNQFKQWRNKSVYHREAFVKMAPIWGSLDLVEALNDYPEAESYISVNSPDNTAGSESRPWLYSLIASAACIIFLVFAGMYYQRVFNVKPAVVSSYLTVVGEQKTVNLSDGSVVELDTNSKIRVVFTESARRIQLLTGQAFFKVAHDKTRPFSVFSGKGVVTAVGTQFSVAYRADTVGVVVAEGRVALSSTPREYSMAESAALQNDIALSHTLVELTAQQAAIFTDKVDKVEFLDTAEQQRRLSWRTGLLAFSGESLAEFIDEMSLYTNVRIELRGENIRDLPVAGYFKVGEVEAMFDALEVMLGIDVERVSDNQVVLSKKNKG